MYRKILKYSYNLRVESTKKNRQLEIKKILLIEIAKRIIKLKLTQKF